MQLVDVPLNTAQATGRWLRGLPGAPEHPHQRDHRVVLTGQVRELTTALVQTAAGLADVTAQLAAATPRPRRAGNGPTVTVDLAQAPTGIRRAADILGTIEDLERTAGVIRRSVPVDARGLVGWMADELDSQVSGHPPTAFSLSRPRPPPPCRLLRAAMTRALGLRESTVHAYRHTGFGDSEIRRLHASHAAAALAARPGATLDQLQPPAAASRVDFLVELGHLIELGAVFGIGHRWYPYDIAVLTLREPSAGARSGCGCPVRTAASRR